jgi:uncharacterized protein (DUF4415 family)
MNEKEKSSSSSSESNEVVIDEDDAPALSRAQLERQKLVWRINRKPVLEEEGRDAMRLALHGKQRINIHLDNDVVAFFRARAGGSGYQTLINSALRAVVQQDGLVSTIEQVVRETMRREFALQREGHPVVQSNSSTTGRVDFSQSHQGSDLKALEVIRHSPRRESTGNIVYVPQWTK